MGMDIFAASLSKRGDCSLSVLEMNEQFNFKQTLGLESFYASRLIGLSCFYNHLNVSVTTRTFRRTHRRPTLSSKVALRGEYSGSERITFLS